MNNSKELLFEQSNTRTKVIKGKVINKAALKINKKTKRRFTIDSDENACLQCRTNFKCKQ